MKAFCLGEGKETEFTECFALTVFSLSLSICYFPAELRQNREIFSNEKLNGVDFRRGVFTVSPVEKLKDN